MNNILACRFGIGYWLISPPYNNDSCFKFVRAEYLPCDVVIINKNQGNNLLANINYTKKIGIMTLSISNNILTMKTSMTGANRKNKVIKDKKKTYIPIKNTYKAIILALNDIINKENISISQVELGQYIPSLKKLCGEIFSITNVPIRRIWNCLYDYNTRTEGRLQDKLKVLSHYGNGTAKCVKCGNNDLRVLSIDHINGGGYRHTKELGRLGYTLYRWLINNNYPEGYQTLCMNCQWIKRAEKNEYYIRLKVSKKTK